MHTAGIHHLTAIASDPAPNVAFYTEVLGLRLVKRTVNFDDPGSYHLYFGDELGRPGTIFTFFLWPGARRGRSGGGEVVTVGFAITRNSFEFWKERLCANGINVEETESTFGERRLRFTDPDGLLLQLVIPSGVEGSRDESLKVTPRSPSPALRSGRDDRIPLHQQILGFFAPTLRVSRAAETEKLLVEILGCEFVAEENKRRRFRGRWQNGAAFIDILPSDERPGHIAVGSVHHIAFRAADADEQLRWREQLSEAGFVVSPVMDRKYFRSIYFREPSGILFEIATDGPGFTIDEKAGALGQALQLPPAFEPMRTEIERSLPPLERSGHERVWLARMHSRSKN
jgi:glyoxalase family protein